MTLPQTKPPRIQIEDVWPQIDCGRYPVKRSVGDEVEVWATIFRDGHELLGASVLYRAPGTSKWQEAPLTKTDQPDRWTGLVPRRPLRPLGVDDRGLGRPLRVVARRAAPQGRGRAEGSRERAAGGCGAAQGAEARREDGARLDRDRPLRADAARPLARGRLRPRRWRASAPGTSSSRARGAASRASRRRCPQLAALGFDVLYFPPIHPIGVTNRKGRNNTLAAKTGDPGSPWAIGGAEGGHTAVNPELGTIDDFDRLVARARKLGIEIALDFAIQCSPDHPWLKEHPDWFHRRPDGTLKYAENPPKRYQDIYNVNFDSEDWQGLWAALRDVVLHWVGPRRQGLPRRQPAHEAAAVLGVADRRRCARSTRRSSSSPRRSRARR